MKIKVLAQALSVAWIVSWSALAEEFVPAATASYSQKQLLKNWALSACLATVATDPASRADANATASAYLEFGRQPLEAYQELRQLVERYLQRKYSGSIDSKFNTMKCIDLFNSKELDILADKLLAKS